MYNASYIGRIGALAVALGVGIAVANPPAVAFAEPGEFVVGFVAGPDRLDHGLDQHPDVERRRRRGWESRRGSAVFAVGPRSRSRLG